MIVVHVDELPLLKLLVAHAAGETLMGAGELKTAGHGHVAVDSRCVVVVQRSEAHAVARATSVGLECGAVATSAMALGTVVLERQLGIDPNDGRVTRCSSRSHDHRRSGADTGNLAVRVYRCDNDVAA